MRNECTGYYEKIEEFFDKVKNNVDKKPYIILGLHGICCFLFCYVYSAIMGEDNSIYRIILYVIGTCWGLSLFLGLIYMITAIFKSRKKGKKLFVLSVTPTLFLFLILFNMVILFWAIDEFYYFTEWIPLIIFWLLPCGWCVCMIKRIRKEIRGEEVKPLNIWLWIVVALVSIAPISSLSGKRRIVKWMPENMFLYYIAYVITLLNLVAVKYLLDMLMYCKITLFGKNKK